ncbi:unnamed protein product [Prorocentrum cordatum]|uniref:Uncharacterized protein n=1 Tax=Prorocentrum cordatum TaxID=2364126 RepID=A0ABN9UXU2_9DINO|nr:unnamed protein product [Polarella glacialis]
MRIRREGMRHQGATARSFTRSASDASLYENRTMFGNYSVQLRRNKALRDGFMGSPSGASSRTPLAFSGQRTGKSKMGDHPHLKLLKMLQLTMEESTRSTEECIKQAGLGDDSQELQDASPGARPASATVSSGTRARPGPSGRAASAGTRRHRGDAAR